MKCPRCDSDRVFHSRAKSLRDRFLKRLLPVPFYRCHDCEWRRSRLKGGPKAIALHGLSLVGYVGGAGLIAFVIAIVLTVTLTFLGIPVPWRH